MLAFGSSVSPEFRARVRKVAIALGLPPRDEDGPSWLMAVMAFETGRTFAPGVKNAAGSGAVGLIQFMPDIAAMLGTTPADLAKMSAVEQLDYVEDYFAVITTRRWLLKNLGDVYLAVLWPAAVGRDDGYVVFRQGGERPKLYFQNRGLDLNRDGEITRAEIVARVKAEYERGMKPPFVFEGEHA